MDRIERIRSMEEILDEGRQALCGLEKALDRFSASLPQLQILESYYLSPDWRNDLDSDVRGELPADLRRGVLSEDGIYDLLVERDELLRRMRCLPASGAAE